MVTRNGWLVLGLAIVTLGLGFALHYTEMVAVGVGLALCFVMAISTVRTRTVRDRLVRTIN